MRCRKVLIMQVFFREHEQLSLSFYLAEAKRGKIDIRERWEDLQEGEKLPAKLSSGAWPVYLQVSGEGVLIREVSETRSSNLSEMLPGFQDKHYFFQLEALQNKKNLLSLVRKDLVLDSLKRTGFEKLCFCGLFIGPSPVLKLSSYIEKAQENIQLDAYCLSFKDGELEKVERNTNRAEDNSLTFVGEKVLGKDLIPLASSLLALNSPEVYTLGEQIFESGKREAFYAFWGRTILKFGLGILLLVLLVNYLLFDYSFKRRTFLDNELASSKVMLQELTDLKSTVEQKQSFISSNKLDEFYYLSYFADQIGLITPGQIRLDKLSFNPVSQKIKPNQAVEFRKGTLFCEGTASDIESYRQFIADMKGMYWVKDILSQDYAYKPGETKASFRLELKCIFDTIRKP